MAAVAQGNKPKLPPSGKEVEATYCWRRENGCYREAVVEKTRINMKTRKEEFYIRYIDLTEKQNEWVNKSRLLSKSVKDEDATNVPDQDMAENGDAEDEAATAEAEAATAEDEAKAATAEDEAEAATAEDEAATAEDEAATAEDEAMTAEYEAVTNVMDQDMADNRKADQKTEDGEPKAKRAKTEVTEAPGHGSMMETEQVEMSQPVSMCPEHDERVKLYCKDDGDLGCIICRDSLKHKDHSFLPIPDAVGVYRPQLPVWLTPLQEALKVTKQLNSQQSEKIKQYKSELEEPKQQVVTEFKRLQAILRKQEEMMLKQLEQQQDWGPLKEMETNLTMLQENEEKLEQAIATAKEKMKATDTNTFLTGMKSLLTLYEEQKTPSTTHTLINRKPSRRICKDLVQYSLQRVVRPLIAPPVTQQQNERMNKPLLLTKPVKDEDATNVQDQDMAENGKANQKAEVEDGEPEAKRQLPVWLTPLQEALKVTKQLNSQQSKEIKQHKNDMEEHMEQIMVEFEKLQALLQEQEEMMQKQLQEQEGVLLKEMETNLSKIQETQEKLEQAIATAEEKMKATDTNSYLTGIKSLLALCEELKTLSTRHAVITKKPSQQISRELIQDAVKEAVRSRIGPSAERKNKPQPVQKPTTTPPSAEWKNEPQPVQQPTTTPPSGVKQVLLIGDGLITATEAHVKQTMFALNLGFPRNMLVVHWKRVVEPEWCNFIPQLKKAELEMKCRPDVIIIHLGEADLNKLNHEDLARMILRHLREITAMYPGTVVMWSHMIVRRSCIHTPLHQHRLACNQLVSSGALAGKYFVVPHKKVVQVLSEDGRQPLQPGLGVISFTDEELEVIFGDFIFAIKKAIEILRKDQ